MATVVSQHVPRHLAAWPPSCIFQKLHFQQKSSKFFETSRRHVFTASNTNIIKNRVEEIEVKTNFVKKLQFSFSNFNLHKEFCISYNC